MRLFILILLCISALSTSVTPDPKNDEINVKQVFPALANQNVGNIYSGYMQVASSRILHYWYAQVRSPLQQANVPLIAWFNGGPGCSSLDGAFYENGPFYFQSESFNTCLLYTSDAADEEDSVDLGGRRIIKKKKKHTSRALHRPSVGT
eukprot:TRINITY_DN48_c0_g1_i10.p1 TRINITY_DN48_c0_g1~~TRINITY_DN48_c0_g1_i10.p1  ORF type:complete len:149 (-),score=15.04 TRINITY_DN48_c0_g1_i10:59-505(-)